MTAIKGNIILSCQYAPQAVCGLLQFWAHLYLPPHGPLTSQLFGAIAFFTVVFLAVQHEILPLSCYYQLVSPCGLKQMWNCSFPAIFDFLPRNSCGTDFSKLYYLPSATHMRMSYDYKCISLSIVYASCQVFVHTFASRLSQCLILRLQYLLTK